MSVRVGRGRRPAPVPRIAARAEHEPALIGRERDEPGRGDRPGPGLDVDAQRACVARATGEAADGRLHLIRREGGRPQLRERGPEPGQAQPRPQPGLPRADVGGPVNPPHVGVAALPRGHHVLAHRDEPPQRVRVLGRERAGPARPVGRDRIRRPVPGVRAGEGGQRLIDAQIGRIGKHERIVAWRHGRIQIRHITRRSPSGPGSRAPAVPGPADGEYATIGE